MDEILSYVLREAIADALQRLDTLVAQADLPSLAKLAESEIGNLTAAWRKLLNLHQPDHRGRCPQCSSWLRARPFPCHTWLIAHQYLVASRLEDRRHPKTAPFAAT
jgi:hypothetical protein